MDEERIGITDMQCHVLRMAEKKWGITAKACSDIFRKYNILEFIEDCYDSLHLNSYQCALDDVETLLHDHGVSVYPQSYIDELRDEIEEVKAKIESGEQSTFNSVDEFFSKLG